MDTDASRDAIGAILSQEQDGHEKVITYASRILSKSERSYCVTRKELLAVVLFVKGFRHFLEGRQFRLRTDHSSLRRLMKFKKPDGQLSRWLKVLSIYDMLIEHRPGTQHRMLMLSVEILANSVDSFLRGIKRKCLGLSISLLRVKRKPNCQMTYL